MKIIFKYMAAQFCRIWIMVLAAFLAIFYIIDFIEKISDFLEKGLPFGTIALFFAAQLPKVITLMAPVATLVAVLLSVIIMARNFEIVAFKAGGISLYKLSLPYLTIGFTISCLMFVVANFVAPPANAKANYIWEGQVRGRLSQTHVVNDAWLRSPGLIQHMEMYDENTGDIRGLTITFLDDDGSLTKRLEAAGAVLNGGNLILKDVLEKKYISDSGRPYFTQTRLDTYTFKDWPKPAPGLAQAATIDSNELSVGELWRAIDRLKSEGFSAVRQKVDLNFKFSFTMLSLVMVILGLPLAFWKETGGSVAMGLTVGILLSFVYLVAIELARMVGYAGLLPPVLAAWMPNLIFVLIGAYMFSYVRQ